MSRKVLPPLAIILLILAAALPAPLSSSSGVGAADWVGNEGNYPLNWNYSPQTAIDSSNVLSLQARWTFPVPSAPSNYSGAEGVMVTPLIVKGIAYVVTNWHGVFAINAGEGDVIWFKDLPLQANYSLYLQPSVPGPLGLPLGHYHQMVYTSHILQRSLVWVIANTYQIFALDAYTGDVVVSFNPMAHDRGAVPGNFGLYDVDTPSMLVDDSRGILVFGPSVSEGESAGRGFVEGWDVSSRPPVFMWRSFIIPSQDGSGRGWSFHSVGEMDNARIFDGARAVDLKALSTQQLNAVLGNDWGGFGFDGTRSHAGASSAWGGSWAIDEKSGLAYLGTSAASPDWNATDRPGPNLWSNSVLAVNLTDGRFVWGFQALPHGLGDFDCSWNVVLANETIAGQVKPVVFKGCKNGYIFALDAETGSMLWYLKPPSIKWVNVNVLDPLNPVQMTAYNWNGFPARGTILQNPSDTGALESDLSYDPHTNLLFAAVYNSPKLFQMTSVGASSTFNQTEWEFNWGIKIFTITSTGGVNTTVMAIDASTGQIKWSHFIPVEPYRGGLTVSGGVVFVSTLDGSLSYLSEQDGSLIGSKTIGGSLLTQPAIGQDANGTTLVILTDMGSSRWGPVFPGFLQALYATSLPTVRQTLPGFDSTYLVLVGAVAAVVLVAIVWVRRRGSRGHSPEHGDTPLPGKREA